MDDDVDDGEDDDLMFLIVPNLRTLMLDPLPLVTKRESSLGFRVHA